MRRAPGRGDVRLAAERVDIASIIARAADSVRPLMAEREHVFSLAVPHERLWLDADPIRLEQVLVNLLSNASRYSEPGGQISLEASGDDQSVRIRVPPIRASESHARCSNESSTRSCEPFRPPRRPSREWGWGWHW